MSRPRKTVPSYLKHSNGQARMVWTDAAGDHRYKLLPGAFNSPESLQAFARLQLELAVAPTATPRIAHGPTVAEVLAPYIRHAATYYESGSELEAIKSALKAVRELYGFTPAVEFGPLALAAVREAFVRKGWSRPYCNRQTQKVVRAFRWAVAGELLPATVHHALKALAPLRKGKTEAPEPPPRLPADPAAVAAAAPRMPPHVRSIVDLIRLTGMRPSEACRMTLGRIDRAGDVWLCTPTTHKTEHQGKHRTVALGAAAQAVIVAHLGAKVPGADEPLFSPHRQREERFAAMRAGRKTKVQPSQASRKKATPRKAPGEWFTPAAVCRAVATACRKAGVPTWSPYQLRHLKGADLREQGFSLEHVRAALGHSHAAMSAHYAKGADLKLAEEVARKAG